MNMMNSNFKSEEYTDYIFYLYTFADLMRFTSASLRSSYQGVRGSYMSNVGPQDVYKCEVCNKILVS